MATQLALQRNFVTITPANQITSSSVQSTQSIMTTSPTTNGDIVTITATGNPNSQTENNGAPVHIMQSHTQVSLTLP